jgi:hypothetical protein
VEVITNHHPGQMVIARDFKRYVIGYGLARKIMVQPREAALGAKRPASSPSKQT